MTQKAHQSDSSESDDEDETVTVKMESDNPWLGSNKSSDPLDEAFSGYRKFWEDHNKNEKETKKIKNEIKKSKTVEFVEEDLPVEPEKEEDDSEQSESEEETESDESENENSSKFINDLFDEAEEKISNKMQSKLTELKPSLLAEDKKEKKDQKKKRGSNVHDANYLGFAKKAKLGDVDEALNEGNNVDDDFPSGRSSNSKKLLKEIKLRKEEKAQFMRGSGDINPDSFITVKSKHLITAIPKSQDFEEIDDEFEVEKMSKANKMSLAEAFENDDIVNDFEEEVENEFNKNLVVENTVVPGWGSWGGHGVKERKPKINKKLPDAKKKDRIIISSARNEKLQKHLVSSVPFPFKSVEDFEASMRLPIGRDFIPESAHQKLIMPSVITKAGTIIEPMNEDILVQNNSVKNNFVKRGKKNVGKVGRKAKK